MDVSHDGWNVLPGMPFLLSASTSFGSEVTRGD